jgi:histone acetyltransferase (RNA polymerase elongator complex component)
LKEYGFRVGVQLMPGLPGETEETFKDGVEKIVTLRPDMVRLYPAVVIRGTELEGWYEDKRFEPLKLDDAVRICRDACIRFEGEGIPVIRIGLMSTPSMEGQVIGGPWHPAMGFLVRSAVCHKAIETDLAAAAGLSRFRIRVRARDIPLVRGYRNEGLRRIEQRTAAKVVGVIGDDSIPEGRIGVENAEYG